MTRPRRHTRPCGRWRRGHLAPGATARIRSLPHAAPIPTRGLIRPLSWRRSS